MVEQSKFPRPEGRKKSKQRAAQIDEQLEAQERALRDALRLPIEPDLSEGQPDLEEVSIADMMAHDSGPSIAEVMQAGGPEPDQAQTSAEPVPGLWESLRTIPLDVNKLDQNLVITASRNDPSHAAFDVLRTRLLQALAENNWKRVAITSPTRDCGKTFVSVNLAISLSRYRNRRTVLMDLDMRNPSVAKTLGEKNVGSIGDYLRGDVSLQDHFQKFGENDHRVGSNLAIAMNDKRENYASELMQRNAVAERIQQMEDDLAADILLFDLPPALVNDDVIVFKKNFDGVLIVIDGTRTSAGEVREVMHRLGKDFPLLGLVLNKAETASSDYYGY